MFDGYFDDNELDDLDEFDRLRNTEFLIDEDDDDDNVLEKEDDDFINFLMVTGKDKEFFGFGNNDSEEDNSNGCYLTSACMRFYQDNFDDNCYELFVLRWFRDNYVSKSDIKYYYNVAPKIVNEINKLNNANMVYDYVYDNIVDYCVKEIENGNYLGAYARYKDSVLSLENSFVKKKTLNKNINKTSF